MQICMLFLRLSYLPDFIQNHICILIIFLPLPRLSFSEIPRSSILIIHFPSSLSIKFVSFLRSKGASNVI